MSIVKQDIGNLSELINNWLKAESEGVKFPVPFDVAWQIAGYARKSVAKRRLARFKKDADYCTDECKNGQRGRSSDLVYLSCDAFKHFCLLAETEEGQNIRQYFIEAEKKWKLVEQHHPAIAHEVELIKLRNEGLKLEAEKNNSELKLMQFRQTITTTCPESVQQKILGYQIVEKTEVIERTIDTATGKSYEGVGIGYLTKRYGFKNNKQTEDWLTRHGLGKYQTDINGNPNSVWQKEYSAIENAVLPREYLKQLDVLFKEDNSRQMFLGE